MYVDGVDGGRFYFYENVLGAWLGQRRVGEVWLGGRVGIRQRGVGLWERGRRHIVDLKCSLLSRGGGGVEETMEFFGVVVV